MDRLTNEDKAKAWEFAAQCVARACERIVANNGGVLYSVEHHAHDVIITHLLTKAAIIRRNAKLGPRRKRQR